MIAIDASVLAKYILLEPGWEQVEELLLKDVISLDYALVEVSNALWKHHVLYGRISREEFERRSRVIDAIPNVVVLENGVEYLPPARGIALEHKITVYDALYIAQALKYGKLATSDEKQGEIAKKLGIEVFYL
ncbi:type II toxin-antitoxin system VapC family toxin [Thermococcus thermotolerans]|uniref:type II toxin-antitoxin system VapC family toxin n=1 Tax=Thermococcus thermotolerans TaxID=2969672 RepID=UPI0021589A7C|nr:type II toxin-antitoxin system VapC family toxin [Thermococcus thermotolerans]